MFSDECFKDIIAHAHKEYPKESCGLVINGEYTPVINTHDTPEGHFSINPKEYILACNTGLDAIVHSHPNGDDKPSYDDLITQGKTAIPWVIYPMNGKIFWFGDGVPIEPLLGRVWKWGVHDCKTACRDWYYTNWGFWVQDFPVEYEWWKKEPNKALTCIQDSGFYLVTDDFQPGDLCLMSFKEAPLSHLAVYVRKDIIYHHVVKSLSCEDFLSRWERYIAYRFRYKR